MICVYGVGFPLELGNVLIRDTDVDQKISEFASIKSQVKHQHVQVCLQTHFRVSIPELTLRARPKL